MSEEKVSFFAGLFGRKRVAEQPSPTSASAALAPIGNTLTGRVPPETRAEAGRLLSAGFSLPRFPLPTMAAIPGPFTEARPKENSSQPVRNSRVSAPSLSESRRSESPMEVGFDCAQNIPVSPVARGIGQLRVGEPPAPGTEQKRSLLTSGLAQKDPKQETTEAQRSAALRAGVKAYFDEKNTAKVEQSSHFEVLPPSLAPASKQVPSRMVSQPPTVRTGTVATSGTASNRTIPSTDATDSGPMKKLLVPAMLQANVTTVVEAPKLVRASVDEKDTNPPKTLPPPARVRAGTVGKSGTASNPSEAAKAALVSWTVRMPPPPPPATSSAGPEPSAGASKVTNVFYEDLGQPSAVFQRRPDPPVPSLPEPMDVDDNSGR